MSFRRIASSLAAMVLVGGTLVAGAGSASANKVWNQSIGKASAAAPCPTSTISELAAGWSQWSSSWAQWPNQGRGGFVCNREITWEITPAGSGEFVTAGCVPLFGGFYLDFSGGNVLPIGSYSYNEGCTVAGGTPSNVIVVYAANPGDAAVLCAPDAAVSPSGWNPNVYVCGDL